VRSLRKSTKVKYRVIVDSTILYSAINFPKGNEYKLFLKADIGLIEILIFDYVYDEIRSVFQRKNINSKLITSFLETFHNIRLVERDISKEVQTIKIAEQVVSDRKDRPIFVFAKTLMEKDDTVFLVSSDKHLLNAKVNSKLFGRVRKTKQMLQLIEYV
jgi:predicted nucleic acid-binding protein